MSRHDDMAYRVENPDGVDRAELVVGIPSYHEADSIGFVVEQVAGGLESFDRDAVIVNMDNDSDDDTEGAFFAADAGRIPRVYVSTPPGVAGKGNNIRNLLALLEEWQPDAVAVVDADLRSIRPDWMNGLLEPVLEGYDFVTPLYTRHHHDGTITNHVCYPLLFGLCGLDVRQPIGGDFAFAPWLGQRWLEIPWPDSMRQYGIDITMTVESIFGGARIAQVALGTKIHKPSAPKLGPMFHQVVDSLFAQLVRQRERWLEGDVVADVAVFDGRNGGKPQELELDHEQILSRANVEFAERAEVVESVLRPTTGERVRSALSNGTGGLDSGTWVDCVYEALVAFAGGAREEAVTSLRPLYFGRVAGFVRETQGMETADCEAEIRGQARRFRAAREFPVSRLNGHGGGS